jgi:hypothetical protein
MNSRKLLRSAGTLVFGIALAASTVMPVAAVSLTGASWSEMCADADLILFARVASLKSERSDEPHSYGIQTRMLFDNAKTLSGSARDHVAVLLPGGALNGKRITVPGAPQFRVGEEVVLFLRRSEVNIDEYFLLGHGLGVLRCRGDRVIPDIPVEKGPCAAGECSSDFFQRFSAARPVKTNDSFATVFCCVAADLILAALLLAIALRRRRRGLATIILLSGSIAPLMAAFSGRVSADNGPFTYVLEGQSWNLNAPLDGRVQNGRVLWVQGHPAKGSPPATTFAAINEMFDQWASDPASALAFAQNGTSIDIGAATDGHNTVSFMTDPPRSVFDKKTLAITYTITTDDNLHFLDCDIVFNDRDFTWIDSNDTTDRTSLGSVALHEIGHFIGLGHSTNINDVMYPIAQGYRLLSDSDKAGARFLYQKAFHFGTAVASASPTAGAAPLNVAFFSDQSITSTGGAPTVSWDFGDGSPPTSEVDPQHLYTAPGTYTTTLTLIDPAGNSMAQTIVHVDGGGGALLVKSFSFQDSFVIAQHGSDKLSVVLSGFDCAANDTLHVTIGDLSLDSPSSVSSGSIGSTRAAGQPIVLNPQLTFSGPSPLGGTASASFDAKKKELSIKLAGAQFGRVFDVRGPSDNSQFGQGSLPVQLEIVHADGSSSGFLGTVQFNFRIKTGRTMDGYFEKAIQAKM